MVGIANDAMLLVMNVEVTDGRVDRAGVSVI